MSYEAVESRERLFSVVDWRGVSAQSVVEGGHGARGGRHEQDRAY